jgi:hypothetical protein
MPSAGIVSDELPADGERVQQPVQHLAARQRPLELPIDR